MSEEIPYHIPSAFTVGRYVQVVDRVPEAHAWHEDWTDGADALVGKTVKVIEKDDIRGFFCEKRGMLRAWLPSAALQATANTGVVIEVPSI